MLALGCHSGSCSAVAPFVTQGLIMMFQAVFLRSPALQFDPIGVGLIVLGEHRA